MKKELAQWIEESNPWTKYRYYKAGNLFSSESEEQSLRRAMVETPQVQKILAGLKEYFPQLAKRHDDPKLSHYQFRLLADLGLRVEDGLQSTVDAVYSTMKEGLFTIRQELPVKGWDKNDQWNALPCDNPVILSTLLKLGIRDTTVMNQVASLKEKWRDTTGWFCGLSFVNGQYKREQTGCPMAALQTMEVMLLAEGTALSSCTTNAFNAIKYHYDLGKNLYYFGRGKKFHTVKYPFVWYNALYMLEVLSQYPSLHKEKLVEDLVLWLRNSSDEEGKYRATSMFMPYKGWDFANKKEPAPWLTLLAYEILERFE